MRCDSRKLDFVVGGRVLPGAMGRDPTAERLLRNMLRYAARNAGKTLSRPERGYGELLKTIGYD